MQYEMGNDQNERYSRRMTPKQLDLGPTGQAVAKNIKRLRAARNLTYAEMSRRLAERGQAIPELGLRRIENGQRKVDVDDLVALAYILNTTPDMLLMPEASSESTQIKATSLGELTAKQLWEWLNEGQLTDDLRDPFVPVSAQPTFLPPSAKLYGFRPEGVAVIQQLADEMRASQSSKNGDGGETNGND